MSPSNRRVAVAAFAALFASPAPAAEFWSDATTITQIYPHSAGMTFFVTYSNPLSTCGGTRWLISSTHPNYKVLVGTLLLAHAQGLRITFHVNDQPATCEPEVDRFVAQR